MSSTSSFFRRFAAALAAVAFLALPMLAAAHPGHYHPGEDDEFATQAVATGLEHPVTGVDHLLAALAVGWVCAALGARRALSGMGIFLAALILGGVAGRAGMVVPGLEAALGISVLTLGLLVVSGRQLSFIWLMPAIAVVAMVHGSAHGSEGPSGAGATGFALGFVLSTAVFLAAGVGLRVLAARSAALRRLAGAALAGAGALFLWQAAV